MSTRRRGPVDPRLLRYARGSRGFFLASAGLAVLQTAATIGFAWFLTAGILDAIEGRAPSAALAGLGGAIALRALVIWLTELTAQRAAAKVGGELRRATLTAVERLGPEWLAAENSARVALVAGRGLDALGPYFSRYLPQLVLTALATPILLAVIWWRDWISGLTVLLTLPLIPVFMVLIGLLTQSVQRSQWQTLQRLTTRFADTVAGLGTLRLFGREERVAENVARTSDDYRRSTMKVLRMSFLSGFALEFLASISVAIVAVSIGLRMLDGDLELSVGLFVLLLTPEAYLPLRNVGVQFHASAEGVAATEDVFAILDGAATREDVDTRSVGSDALGVAGPVALRFDAVRVRRGERLLPPVSFTAEPGTVTLIEGPSGAGKSSLLAALRGSAPFEGEIAVGETTLRGRGGDWLAWAGQTPGLLAMSVRDNVALGDPVPDDDRVRRCLDEAGAREIDAHTMLGVRGAGLSGGQAQRVAVARALYRRSARVLALDEPSSALDSATEAVLWRALRARADEGQTVLLVSHRESARAISDRIVTLEGVPA